MRAGFAALSHNPALYLFLLNQLLISPLFFPSLLDLGPFDEINYLNAGRSLAEGWLPDLAFNPLVAGLHAVGYLLFRASPFWVVHIAGFGRFVVFSLLWLAAYVVGRRLAQYASPLIMGGILLVSPLLGGILNNPSDALFAALSGFSFWQLLCFYQSKQIRHAGLASLFLGLAALARSDGLVLFPILIVLVILTSRAEGRSLRWLARSSIYATAPFLVLVGGYFLFYGLRTGIFELGTASRTYLAFEQGQEMLFHAESGNPTIEAQEEARRLFGTAEDNEYSILNAIRRNPAAFAQRLKQSLLNLFPLMLQAYDKRLGVIFFLFAARGIWSLASRKQWLLLAMLLLWPLHLLVYFLTFFREGYLQFVYFVVYALAAIGLNAALSPDASRREKIRLLLIMFALTIYGYVDNKLAITAGASVFLLGLGLIWVVLGRQRRAPHISALGLVMALCLALIVRGNYPSPGIRALGSTAEEQALLFMVEHLDPGSVVGTYAPGYILAARMAPFGLASRNIDFESSEDLHAWLLERGVQAIYSTDILRTSEPELWALMEDQIGKGLDRAFRQDPHDVQVLLVRPQAGDG